MLARDLVTNVALLVALSVLHSLGMRAWKRRPRLRQVTSGIVFGGVAIAGMAFPFRYAPGVIFDGRSIVLSIAGLFGGWPVAASATTLAVAYRIWLGGTGMWTGMATAVTSAVLGVAYRGLRKGDVASIPPLHLWVFGLVVQIAVLLWMFTLPWPLAFDALKTIALPFLALFPLGTLVLGSLLADEERREQAESALRESEARVRSIFRAAPIGIGVVCNRVLLDVNDTVCQMTGYSRQELIGQNARILYPSDEEYNYVGKEKYAQIQRTGTGSVETRWRRKDGSVIHVLLSSALLEECEPTSPQVVTFTALDITERERLSAQVREQAHRLQQTLDALPEGILLIGPEHCIIAANPRAVRDLAVLAPEVKVGDTLARLGDRPLMELLASPPTPGLWHEIRADGRIFEVISRPVGNGAEAEYYVLVINDVTREREIRTQQAQQERLAAVGQLAAGIAHDFNNTLAVILLYAQLLARSQELSERDREKLIAIEESARQATRLVQQILDFSRQAVLERRPLDLLPLLKEQTKMLERTLPENIEVRLEHEDGEYIVNADPTRIQQAVLNLVLNARDAMSAGGTLCIKLERMRLGPGKPPPLPELKAGEWICLTVADTGVGIPPEVLPRIFEPFFTTKPSGRGSGLGLPQVYGIVKRHEGEIHVSSQVGHGTTVRIYLPVLQVQPPVGMPSDDTFVPRGNGETVLVVEDATATRAALREALEGLNYRVLEASDGDEALALMEREGHRVAVLLSDIVMPRRGGIALLHALRQRGWHVPAILLTGHPLEKTEIEELQAVGLSTWLSKPPTLGQLARALADALRNQPMPNSGAPP